MDGGGERRREKGGVRQDAGKDETGREQTEGNKERERCKETERERNREELQQ